MSRVKKEPQAMPFGAREPVPDARYAHARAFAPCPVCGMLVQVRTWVGEQGWTPNAIPVSTALGVEHSVAQGTCTPRTEDAP